MIFADSSFWIALRNQDDAWHSMAVDLLRLYRETPIVTSNMVRGETWTFLRRRAGHAKAMQFLDLLNHTPRVRVFPIERDMETSALRWLRRHDEREYSFVEATSFVVMRTLRMREALAFDSDFAAAGFHELRVEQKARNENGDYDKER